MKAPTRTHLGNRGEWDRPTPPAVFPHAQSARLEQAPDRCDRCGSFWRLTSDGLQCRGCSRHWLVGEMLAELVGHALDHEAGGHIASERTQPKRAG